jgi:hypothetical protein
MDLSSLSVVSFSLEAKPSILRGLDRLTALGWFIYYILQGDPQIFNQSNRIRHPGSLKMCSSDSLDLANAAQAPEKSV